MQVQTAIAQHLNIAETAIIKIEEWAHVIFVVARGLGGRFVSKKVIPTMKKRVVSPLEAAQILVASLPCAAKIWDKKAGETRIYTPIGYIRLAAETADKAQVQYFTKSYEINSLKPSVNAFNELYTISDTQLISNDPLSREMCRWCRIRAAVHGEYCDDCVD